MLKNALTMIDQITARLYKRIVYFLFLIILYLLQIHTACCRVTPMIRSRVASSDSDLSGYPAWHITDGYHSKIGIIK